MVISTSICIDIWGISKDELSVVYIHTNKKDPYTLPGNFHIDICVCIKRCEQHLKGQRKESWQRWRRLRGKLVRYDVRCWRDVTSVFFLRPSALDNSTSRHRRLPVVINRRLECMRGLFASNIAKSSFFGTEKRHASRDRSVVLRPCGRAFRGVGILCTGNHFVVFALHVLEI